MASNCETLIVGGGMAGMFCALRLAEAGRPCSMITERLGGRVMYRPELEMNFGAAFYFDNYHHVKRIVTPGPPVFRSFGQIMFHRGPDEHYPALGMRVLKHARRLLRFRRFMKTFSAHYEAYKRNCETMPVKAALAADPFLGRLFFKTADELLDELGIKEACRESISLFAYACTGERVGKLTAFDYCYLAQGLVMPIHFFSFDEAAVRVRIGEVVFDSVVEVTRTGGRHTVTTATGKTFHADNLVIATTATVARELLGLPGIRSASRLFAYLVKGSIKRLYRDKDIHLFADTSPIIFLARRERHPGQYALYSTIPLDLADYFDTHEILGEQEWPQAIYTHPAIVLDQDLGEGLYLAGDHNGMGMEPAAISGIFAANRIVERSAMNKHR